MTFPPAKTTLKNWMAVKFYTLEQKPSLREVFMRRMTDSLGRMFAENEAEYYFIEFSLEPKLYLIARKSNIKSLLGILKTMVNRPKTARSEMDDVQAQIWGFVYRGRYYWYGSESLPFFIAAIIHNQNPDVMACCRIG